MNKAGTLPGLTSGILSKDDNTTILPGFIGCALSKDDPQGSRKQLNPKRAKKGTGYFTCAK